MFKFHSITKCLCLWAAAGTLTAAQSRGHHQETGEDQRQLIAILKSDAADAEKAISCKRLAIFGDAQAVPALTPLLTDPRLASWARIAPEAIPGPEADAALRESLDQLQGELLIGVINSIGVRRDQQAVDRLAALLNDTDNDSIASAAAVALGRIAGDSATHELLQALDTDNVAIRDAVAEGCILCAERRWAGDQRDQAAEIYDQVREAQVTQQRVLEATRGAILARQSAGIPLLLEQLRSPDKRALQMGLSAARELAVAGVAEALAEEVQRADPTRAALLLLVLGDRQDSAALPIVLRSAESGPTSVRVAAVHVLQRLGDASCVPTLLAIAAENDAELAEAAMVSLSELPGAEVDAAIRARLEQAQGKQQVVLLELVGRRQIDAARDLIQAIDHADAAVRQAALTALGAIVGPQDLQVLIKRVVAVPKNPAEQRVARQALQAACLRMPDREDCAKKLVAGMSGTTTATKVELLEILGAVGGQQALQAMGQAARARDSKLQDVATRLLGQWMTTDAGPVLLKLAELPNYKHRIRALRGYIRLARQFNMPDQQRAEVCRNALNAATRNDERKLVLQVIERYPSMEMLNLAIALTDDAEFKDDAVRLALTISQKLGDQSVDAQKLLARIGYGPVRLEIIKAEYGAGSKQQDVTAKLRDFAGELPMIILPSSTYNASFGGDPASGVPKQLRIQYRMNGKAGEVVFAENAVILLPIPK